jgi:hypothetical protein
MPGHPLPFGELQDLVVTTAEDYPALSPWHVVLLSMAAGSTSTLSWPLGAQARHDLFRSAYLM